MLPSPSRQSASPARFIAAVCSLLPLSAALKYAAVCLMLLKSMLLSAFMASRSAFCLLPLYMLLITLFLWSLLIALKMFAAGIVFYSKPCSSLAQLDKT